MAKILIVDDEPTVRSLLREILEREGHQCAEAPDVALGWEVARDGRFDLVTCDINLPDASGLELLGKCQPLIPDTAVVMVTVITDVTVARKALELGAFGYIAKPFESSSVIINVACALKRREVELANKANRDDLEALVAQSTVELRASEHRYRSLVQTITEGLVSLDAEGRLAYFNDRFAEMLGYLPTELAGRRITDFIDKTERRNLVGRLGANAKLEQDSFELSWRTKTGESVMTMVYARVLRDNAGEVNGYQALVTDITEQKVLEAQMLQAQKLESIGQLAAGIAHEINTPTQYVADNTRFLQKSVSTIVKLIAAFEGVAHAAAGGGDMALALEKLEEARRGARLDYLLEELPAAIEESLEGLERISKIVKSMKSFAHPGAEALSPVDINKAIEDTITVARNEWKYVAEMETDLDPELAEVPCYPGEFNQVVLNILVNAAQAIGEAVGSSGGKGLIRVTTRKSDGMAEIRIADNGPGVPAAIADRIFDPFFTTKPPGKGTGQGLAIAHRVITQKHQGEMLLCNNSEGQGATFIIRLPLEVREEE